MIKAGCIKGVLSGYDYNSAWIVHNVVSEALERLQLTLLLTEVSGENILWLKQLRPSVAQYFRLDEHMVSYWIDKFLVSRNKGKNWDRYYWAQMTTEKTDIVT